MPGRLDARLHHAGGTGLRSVEQVRAEARWADEAGFDGFWVSQIFGVDPFVALAAVAHEVPALLLVAGSADDVTEGLAAYVDAGVTDLRISIADPTPDDRDATRAYLSGR